MATVGVDNRRLIFLVRGDDHILLVFTSCAVTITSVQSNLAKDSIAVSGQPVATLVGSVQENPGVISLKLTFPIEGDVDPIYHTVRSLAHESVPPNGIWIDSAAFAQLMHRCAQHRNVREAGEGSEWWGKGGAPCNKKLGAYH